MFFCQLYEQEHKELSEYVRLSINNYALVYETNSVLWLMEFVMYLYFYYYCRDLQSN